MSVINTNVSSLTAQRNLMSSQASLSTAMQRLSSGLRINSAKDDAAGLSISERMTTQIRGSNQAARNANDGISLSQTAEGDLGQITSNLQRMRELAVQSGNATNSVSDRAALDGEVQALSAEIDRVSQNSSFNGVKLLDGSFAAQKFQVGANGTANDSITINSIASTRTSELGGVGSSYEANKTSGAMTGPLVAGDLTLNGFQVGDAKPGLAAGQSTASAFSVAAAINAISPSSGVTAVANANTVTGGAITNFVAGAGVGTGNIAANTFSINGVNVGAIQGGATAAGQGANVAAAINKIANQTGVTATASATDGKLTLTATDGRDISIGMNGDGTMLAAAAATAQTALAAQTGIASTAIGAPPVQTTTSAVSGAFVIPTSTLGTGTFALTIDGISLQAATIIAAPGAVSAATLDTSLASFLTANTGYSATGSFAGGDLAITKNDGTAMVIAAPVTGDTAAGTFGAGFVATAASGAGTGTGVSVAVANHGTVTMTSTSSNGIVYAGAHADRAGLSAAGQTVAATTTSSVSSIASMNVLTADSATKALAAIDGALTTVNASRAALGAIQNRFTSVVTSLQTTAENLSASRSRIQDADFALETANLSRAQVLQQAGTAMVAQANQLPQSVLSLLK